MGSTLVLLAVIALGTPTTLPSKMVQIKVGKKTLKHKVYLTIDDHPNRTSRTILAILKKCKLKATFFVWGYLEKWYRANPKSPPLRRAHRTLLLIHKNGHVLGNHSLWHKNQCKLPKRKIFYSLKTTQDLVYRATKVRMRYWRPPFLVWCRKANQVAQKLKLQGVGAHVSDYKRSGTSMWRGVRLRAKRGKKASIVLFHNVPSKLKKFLKLSGLCSSI